MILRSRCCLQPVSLPDEPVEQVQVRYCPRCAQGYTVAVRLVSFESEPARPGSAFRFDEWKAIPKAARR